MRLIRSIALVMFILPLAPPALSAAPAVVPDAVARSTQTACAGSGCDPSGWHETPPLITVRAKTPVPLSEVLALLGLGFVGVSLVARR